MDGDEEWLVRVQAYLADAERAARRIDNPDLQKIAFDRILEHLLSANVGKSVTLPEPTAPARITSPGERAGPMSWLTELADEGFFHEPRTTKEIISGLDERGHHVSSNDLTRQLVMLVERKVLRRRKQLPSGGKKEIWFYSDW